ncbi:MAG: sigma factor-like helix-turn-helix DNA-binding protein [Patescibacteria group bacterium]
MNENNLNSEEKQDDSVFLGSSILDKIISSKEDQEKQEFNPSEVIAQLLKRLTSKEAEVIKRRFGLAGNKKETLEVIGARYQVTRERIRQIENLAIKKIKEGINFNTLIKPVEQVLTRIINQYGGVMEEDFLLHQLFFVDNNQSDQKATLFILSELLNLRFIKIVSSETYRKAWQTQVADLKFINASVQELIKIIEATGNPLSLEKVYSLFQTTEYYKLYSSKLEEKVIESYLELSQVVARNPFDEYGLKKWGSVLPRRMNDKIYLVLNKENKPMHFVDIAGKITQVFKKKAYPPTVHNELILNKKYVLVGRGIYALSEWGYKRGVVADVLIDILKKRQLPMTKDELLRAVLDQRMVKRNTIYLALTNKKKFKKLADGKYTLVIE